MKYMMQMNVKGGSYQMEGWAPKDIKGMVDFMHSFNTELKKNGNWVSAEGLVAPEFQIINSSSAVTASNYFWNSITGGLHRWGTGRVEYETRLNHVLPAFHDPVICTYDLSRFDASVVIDIMRTHPMVIIGGILQENPFYVPPDEMLKELKERAADKTAN